jgi:hypothetical protein
MKISLLSSRFYQATFIDYNFRRSDLLFLTFFLFCCALILDGFHLNAEQVLQKTAYPQFCQYAVEHDDMLADFRRNPLFRQTQDLPYEYGLQYLNMILSDYPEISEHFDKFRIRDAVGNSIVYNWIAAIRQ